MPVRGAHYGVDARRGFFIRMVQEFVRRVFPNNLKGDKVVHGRFGEKNVFFYNRRNFVPLGFIGMVETAAVAEIIKERYGSDGHRRIEGVSCDIRSEVGVGKRRGGQPKACQGIARPQKRDKTQQDQKTVILMEKNIQQIFFICVFSHPKRFVVDIPIVVKIDQLSDKSCVQDGKIDADFGSAEIVSHREPFREKCTGKTYQDHRIEQRVRIPVHPPPKAVTEAMIKLFPLPVQGGIAAVHHNENKAKQRADCRSNAEKL